MSLDICCDIQMVGSEFGIKNMKAWIHHALSQRFRLVVVVKWCGDILFGKVWAPLSTKWALFICHSLPEYYFWPCPPLYDYSVPIFWWLLPDRIMHMSQRSSHLRLVYWTWQGFHFTQMTSTVTKSQSNRAPLGCGGTGDLHHGCESDNLQQLCYTIMSIWTKISEECFQNLVESMPQRIKAVLKAEGVQPGY